MNFLDYIISQSIEEIQKLDNAMDRIKEIKMSNWNGKVKCVKSNRIDIFTKDKIYEVINGCIKDNIGTVWNNRGLTYSNLSEFHGINSCTVQFEEVKIPVLSELLGVVPNEHFKVKFDNGTISTVIYWIDTEGWMCSDSLYNLSLNDTAIRLINKLYQIVKLPNYQFTENEITILSALYLNDYFYIARDEDGELWTFEENPEECESGEYLTDTGNAFKLKDEFFQQVQWGNVLDIKFELDKLN